MLTDRPLRRLSESSLTLPAAAVAATLTWWLPWGGYSLRLLAGWVACALTAYVVIETAAVHALLRMRSRMVSTVFLLLMAVATPLHELQGGTIAALALALTVRSLFDTAAAVRPEPDTLYACLMLSAGSLAWPPLLWLAPVLMLCQAVHMRTLTPRSLAAALMGLMVPYALWATAAFATGRWQPLAEHLGTMASPVAAPLRSLSTGQPLLPDIYLQWLSSADTDALRHSIAAWARPRAAIVASAGAAVLFAVTGVAHYLGVSADDKIRVRTCHYAYITILCTIVLWMLLQPRYGRQLLPLLIVTLAPSAAHYIALSRSRLAPFWAAVLALALVAALAVSIVAGMA